MGIWYDLGEACQKIWLNVGGGGVENITLLTASTVVKTFCQNAYNSVDEVVKI